ncbi:LamG-like jellyroll fold domain-containing protein [Flavobacterium sp.]|jgi:hypothetical protein|uniref:LamG-like jellyroll fold domain-containing protein n=1 Tax=Flavobacterium sp. TaxID=239 RepID=UPI0037BFB0AA
MKTRKLLTLVIAILAVAITNIQAQTLPSYVPTNGLVGYWGFNGTANDQSGNGNNGTVNGATLTTDRFGNSNSAYSFDGNDFIEIADNPTLNFTTQFSLSFYLKNNELTGGWFWCISKETSNNIGIGTFIAQNVLFYTKPQSFGSITDLSNQSWDLITITNDNGQSNMYKNGVLIKSDIIPISNNTQSLIFGGNGGNDAVGTLNGFLDDIGIWNRVLTQSEITQLYNSSLSTQNLCTKTIQPYNVNVGDIAHEASTYIWSIFPAATNAVITGNGTNSITIDWTNVTNGSYRLQAIETNMLGCESTAVAATINLLATPAPAAQSQTFCANATVANLVATGTSLNWYAAATGATALDSTAILTTGTYYVSQTIGTCESIKTAVEITITPQVTPTFTPIASTCSGFNITALPTTSNNGIIGTWSPAINNNVTTTYTFTPNEGQCAAATTQTIIITTPLITSEISFVAPPITVVPSPSVPTGNQNYSNRKFMIFNVSELNSIDFSTVLETSAQTVRISVDGTKTFVKWDGEMPQCVINLTTKEGPYSYEEILTILSTPAWSAPMQY